MKTTLATFSVGVASVALFSACSHLGGQQDAAQFSIYPLSAAKTC